MRNIYYSCPFCNRRFEDEYMSQKLQCPHCKHILEIHWFSNGTQKYGVVGTTLVCFWGSTGSVTLPDNLTKIGTGVFEKSPNLTEVILSNTKIEEIGENAFLFCFRLENIELPNSLKVIRKQAMQCTGIKKLFIPQKVELIENNAFDACTLIKEIQVDIGNPYYYVQNECLIDKRTNQIIVSCCKNKVFFQITLDSFDGEENPQKFNITKFCKYDEKRIKQALKDVEQSEDKFIICQADTPINNITFLQATSNDNGLYVEFHLLKFPNNKSWENWCCTCNIEKCVDYFFSFIRGKFVPNFDEWELVKFEKQ